MKQNKFLYWGLIIAFFVLYAFVAFVSTLHAVSFFQLTNVAWMAVMLAISYEIGQASVLFAILTSDNNKKLLPWVMMILLTSVQIIGNVYASFKFMDSSGSMDWTYWQRSILFWLEVDGPEMFKVVISWITGALLPVVALGMTALVAENLKLKDEQDNKILGGDELDPEPTNPKEYKKEEFISPSVEEAENEEEPENSDLLDMQDSLSIEDFEKVRIDEKNEELKTFEERRKESLKTVADTFADELLNNRLSKDPNTNKPKDPESGLTMVEKPVVIDIPNGYTEDGWLPGHPGVKFEKDKETIQKKDPSLEELKNNPRGKKITKKPHVRKRGWHLKKEYVDSNGDVYNYGIFNPNETKDIQLENKEPKKA
jgi:hypothetical protein